MTDSFESELWHSAGDRCSEHNQAQQRVGLRREDRRYRPRKNEKFRVEIPKLTGGGGGA